MTTSEGSDTTYSGINDLMKNVILDVEKVLNRLPTSDDRLDVVTMSEDKASNDVDISLGDYRSTSSFSSNSNAGRKSSPISVKHTDGSKKSRHKGRVRRKATARILSDSIKVFPMAGKNGMLIDMMLHLHKKHPEEMQLIDIRVECPKCKPSRIRVDGQWYNIV